MMRRIFRLTAPFWLGSAAALVVKRPVDVAAVPAFVMRSLAADIMADSERVLVGELGALGDGFLRAGRGPVAAADDWFMLNERPLLSI